MEKGFFKDEGIEAENIQVDAAHVQEAVGAGQVDVGAGLISKFMQPVENGLPVKFVFGMHRGCIKVLTLKGSPITSLEQLKGKKVGVPGLADAAILILKRALVQKGISVDDKNPEVGFVVYSVPTCHRHWKKVLLMLLLWAILRQPSLKKNPELAAAATRALLKASAWVKAHPEETAKIQLDKKYVAGELALNAKLLKSYNYNLLSRVVMTPSRRMLNSWLLSVS